MPTQAFIEMGSILIKTLLSGLVSLGLACSLLNATRHGPLFQIPELNTNRKEQLLSDMTKLGVLRPNFSEWYAAPGGKATGSGSLGSPVDLATALSGGFSQIRPGDVLWLRGGSYSGPFTSEIEGSSAMPVNVRQFPGERAILEKRTNSRETGALDVRGDHVWFWDFEVANSSTDRKRLDPDGEHDPMRGSGVNVYAADTRYINLIVHDNGHGFGLWNEKGGTEIYGCIIFNNGNNKKEHGIYGHNKTGAHAIRNNIIFNNAGYGLHLYANSVGSSVSGFDIDRNTIFNNGSLMADDQVADQILVGGVKGVPAERISLVSNYIFNELDAPTSKNRGIRLGYEDTANKDVRLFDNYIVSKVPLRILWWESVEARGNTIFTVGKTIELLEPTTLGKKDYRLASNTYLSPLTKIPGFLLNDGKFTLASWRDEKGFDRDSKAIAATDNAIFVTPNKYDASLASVTIYNWKRAGTVSVDLGKLLSRGDSFEIRDVQDIFGGPTASGIYDGTSISVPMNLGSVTKPIGETERIPRHSGIEFGTFMVTKKGR